MLCTFLFVLIMVDNAVGSCHFKCSLKKPCCFESIKHKKKTK
jgi:hypothetical protein